MTRRWLVPGSIGRWLICGSVLAVATAEAHPFRYYEFVEFPFLSRDPSSTIRHESDEDFRTYHDFPGGGDGIVFSVANDADHDLTGRFGSHDSYGVKVSAERRRQHHEVELEQLTYFRKCSDDASLTLTITSLYLVGVDGGDRERNASNTGDYFGRLEPNSIAQLIGSAEMEVKAFKRAATFFHTRGLAALNLFVHRRGDERWRYANLSLNNSAGDFWQGAQFEFRPNVNGTLPIEIAQYSLTEPHRIRVDLRGVPTAPACPAPGEAEPEDDTGQFVLQVRLRVNATNQFMSPVESSSMQAYIQDPADLDNNDSAVTVEADGLQRVSEPDHPWLAPSATELLPDADCVAP